MRKCNFIETWLSKSVAGCNEAVKGHSMRIAKFVGRTSA